MNADSVQRMHLNRLSVAIGLLLVISVPLSLSNRAFRSARRLRSVEITYY